MHHILTAKTFCETNTTLELKLHPTTYRKNISCIAYGTTQTIPMREHQLGESSRDWWSDNKRGNARGFTRTESSLSGPLTDFAWLRPATNRNHTRQEAHKHQAPVAPRTPDLSNQDVCSHHTESNAPTTELRDRQIIWRLWVDCALGAHLQCGMSSMQHFWTSI